MARPKQFKFNIVTGTYEDAQALYQKIISDIAWQKLSERYTKEQLDYLLPLLQEQYT